jgi:hypothetical protein
MGLRRTRGNEISVVVRAKARPHCGAGNKLDSRFRGEDAALE